MMGKAFKNAMQFDAAVSRSQYFQTLNANFSKLAVMTNTTELIDGSLEREFHPLSYHILNSKISKLTK